MQKKYFKNSLEHILAELERIDLLIQLQLARVRQFHPLEDEFQEINYPEQKADVLPIQSCRKPCQADAPVFPSQADIRTTLDRMRRNIWLRKDESKRRGIRLRLDELEALFDLTPLEFDIFLICMAPEFDFLYEKLYAYLQNDATKIQPSINLISKILNPLISTNQDCRKYFAAEAPLCRYHLLQPVYDPSPQRTPESSKTLKVDERIVNHLLDLDIIDPYLMPYVRRGENNSGFEDFINPAVSKHHLMHMIRNRDVCQQGAVFYFQGPYGTEKASTAESLCRELGFGLLIIDLPSMLSDSRLDFEKTLNLVRREAHLQHAALYWQGFDLLLAKNKYAYSTALLRDAKEQRGITFLAGEKIWDPADSLHDPSFVGIEFTHPDYAAKSEFRIRSLGGDSRFFTYMAANDCTSVAALFREPMAEAP